MQKNPSSLFTCRSQWEVQDASDRWAQSVSPVTDKSTLHGRCQLWTKGKDDCFTSNGEACPTDRGQSYHLQSSLAWAALYQFGVWRSMILQAAGSSGTVKGSEADLPCGFPQLFWSIKPLLLLWGMRGRYRQMSQWFLHGSSFYMEQLRSREWTSSLQDSRFRFKV